MQSSEIETNQEKVVDLQVKTQKKKYCDRNFKHQLAKALNSNCGEPENFDRIRSNKLLSQYDPEKIKEFTSNVSEDIQRHVEHSIKDKRAREIFTLAKILNDISGENKPQELPLLLKLNAATMTKGTLKKDEVNFSALNKFLYSAVSGLPDHVEMNDVTKTLLYETYNNLMAKVEEDAAAVLSKPLRSSSMNEEPPNAEHLLQVFREPSLNPFNLSPNNFLKEKETE